MLIDLTWTSGLLLTELCEVLVIDGFESTDMFLWFNDSLHSAQLHLFFYFYPSLTLVQIVWAIGFSPRKTPGAYLNKLKNRQKPSFLWRTVILPLQTIFIKLLSKVLKH